MQDSSTYSGLSKHELEKLWSQTDSTDVAGKLDHLRQVKVDAYVEVKLVCFDGDGAGGVNLDVQTVTKHFEALNVDFGSYIINVPGGEDHKLAIGHNPIYHVMKTKKSVCKRVTAAVQTGLDKAGESPIFLPMSAVGSILAEDHSSTMLSYSIYLLNPLVFGALPEGADEQLRPPAPAPHYWYLPDAELQRMSKLEDKKDGVGVEQGSRSAASACGSIVGVGSVQRYAWMDLSAGPVAHGPSPFKPTPAVDDADTDRGQATSFGDSDAQSELVHSLGEGYTVDAMIPRVRRDGAHGFVAALAAFVHRSSKALVLRPLDRRPLGWGSWNEQQGGVDRGKAEGGAAAGDDAGAVPRAATFGLPKRYIVRVVRISDAIAKKSGGADAAEEDEEGEEGEEDEEDEHDAFELDWLSLKQPLDSLLMGEQKLELELLHVQVEQPFEQPINDAADADFRSSDSDIIPVDNSSTERGSGGSPSQHLQYLNTQFLAAFKHALRTSGSSTYLDAAELHRRLATLPLDNQSSGNEESASTGAGPGARYPPDAEPVVLSVYLYDLHYSLSHISLSDGTNGSTEQEDGFGDAADEEWQQIQQLRLQHQQRQAVGFDDGMVVAVQTRAAPAATGFTCSPNGNIARSEAGGKDADGSGGITAAAGVAASGCKFDPNDARKAVLGVLLQVGWGVADIAHSWSPLYGSHASKTGGSTGSQSVGRVAVDHLWSVGGASGPFGPFQGASWSMPSATAVANAADSASKMTPTAADAGLAAPVLFVQRDAAAHGAIMSLMDQSVTTLASPLEDMMHHGFELHQLLSPHAYQALTRHWVFFRHKLSRASGYLSLHNYNLSVNYMQILQPDVTALHHLLSLARHNMRHQLACGDTADTIRDGLGISNGWSQGAAVAAAALLLLLLLIIRR
jgi:hypothetical protein